MGKIKLLYALESAGGGTLKHVACLATHIDKSEFDITVVLPDDHYEKDTKRAVELMQSEGIQADIIPMNKRISIKDVSSLFQVISYLRKHHFDIVHAHSSKAGALFRAAAFCVHIPVVIYTPHCFYFTAFTGFRRKFFAALECILAMKTHAIAVSGTEQAALRREHIIDGNKIVVIDNAIDTKEYSRSDPAEIRKLWNIPVTHTVVVGVGRLVKQKDWETFLQTAQSVLRQNRNFTFLIAGEGPCYQQLSDMITRHGTGANVRLCGYRDNITQIYSVADIFVSTSRWEGLPYTYLEALHYQIPMLITHTEGMEYFGNFADATLLQPGDIESFSSMILSIAGKPAPEIQPCRKYPFDLGRFIEQHCILYRRLLLDVNR